MNHTIPPLTESQFPTQEEIDHLRHKFFVGPGDDEIFRKWGHLAMELALEWLKNPEQKKIHADISLPELANVFRDIHIPSLGSEIEQVFEECRKTILENSVRVNNPRYIGHMTTAIPWFSVVVDILITSINQNQVKIETALASSYVERQTLGWLHHMIYSFPDKFYEETIQLHTIALGNITNGGTMGNLTGLAVAREIKFPGIREKGVYEIIQQSGYKGVVVLASQRVHYSLKKSIGILGFGEASVITIPVDSHNHIRLDLLEQKIKELREQNIAILALIGIAGTTETGNIDPLKEMGAIAQRENIWFHVDAAWGGALLLSNDLKNRLSGIEMADSVVIDGHKLFYLPLAHGAVLFKNKQSLNTLRHNANYIIRKGSVDLGRTSLEGSRRFNALKLWFSLKILGQDGYNVLLKKSLRLTDLMKHLIDESPDFERTSEPEICILTYRYVPIQWREQIKDSLKRKDQKSLLVLNNKLNDLNVELQKRQREAGQSFVSRTRLESAGYAHEIVVLRCVLTNLLTRSQFLKEILEEQRSIGQQVFKEITSGINIAESVETGDTFDFSITQ
ncbi:MAG: aminotransferase class V-fold PLP-dependent enzyme [SAR324 cluster bacterium]|nr:aminotransferase class V-fold PLP-dependent enzyme [SAR324 cluster bacterium]